MTFSIVIFLKPHQLGLRLVIVALCIVKDFILKGKKRGLVGLFPDPRWINSLFVFV